MKIKRKSWTKDSLISFLNVKELYDKNPSCEILCVDDGCVFEVELKECDLNFLDVSDDDHPKEYEPYWTYNCPKCDKRFVITRLDFKTGKKV